MKSPQPFLSIKYKEASLCAKMCSLHWLSGKGLDKTGTDSKWVSCTALSHSGNFSPGIPHPH